MNKVKLHLISAPWAHPARPSIQTGTLKAYIDRELGGAVDTRDYPAHLEILHAAFGSNFYELMNDIDKHGELPFLLLLRETFYGDTLEDIIKPAALKIVDRRMLKSLQLATDQYLENTVVPNLVRDGRNVIGFTLNFSQTYASLYMQHWLKKFADDFDLEFVFGGYGASSPLGQKVLRKYGANILIKGEGEKSLADFLRQIILGGRAPRVSSAGQLEMAELPDPNYESYFELVEKLKKADPVFRLFNGFSLPIEGSRGCFARCDFCTLNSQWSGFRKLKALPVFERTVRLVGRYEVSQVLFTDNVCDTWAENFADLVLASPLKLNFFMELRAHHPEIFWVKLREAGMTCAQIGVESLSEPLLKGIGKGTRVIQNLAALKIFKELGIRSNSNLIVGHPKSTARDMRETKRVLSSAPHLGDLSAGWFWLDAGSPLFETLPVTEKKNVLPFKSAILKNRLKDEVFEFRYEVPKSLRLRRDNLRAAIEFKKWFAKNLLRLEKTKPGLIVENKPNGTTVVVDSRRRSVIKIRLSKSEAQVLSACHRGATLESLQRLPLSEKRLENSLRVLLKKKLLLKTGDYFLALPLRPRRELISSAELHKKTGTKASSGSLTEARFANEGSLFL